MGDRGPPAAAADRRQELAEQLEKGFKRVQQSDEYRRYLDTVSRFHTYSVANTMLIWLQRPDATQVAGFRTWLSLGRQVRKGERGIRIFAPMALRRVTGHELDDLDDVEGGRAIQLRFRAVSVFDIAQTEGDELPPAPLRRLSGDDTGLWEALSAVAFSEALTIDRGPQRGAGANGWYRRTGREIWVDPELEPRMSAKTLCHELAHHFAEHIDSRQEHETIAESVAYIVLGHYGIDSADYSFGYLAAWSDVAIFKAKLAAIQAIAGNIIGRIRERRDLAKERLGASLPLPHDGRRPAGLEGSERHDRRGHP